MALKPAFLGSFSAHVPSAGDLLMQLGAGGLEVSAGTWDFSNLNCISPAAAAFHET